MVLSAHEWFDADVVLILVIDESKLVTLDVGGPALMGSSQ